MAIENDAIYCIEGPVCSGYGDTPAGTNCPSVGTVAVGGCREGLPSYAGNDTCVVTKEPKCAIIITGAWGCTYLYKIESEEESSASVLSSIGSNTANTTEDEAENDTGAINAETTTTANTDISTPKIVGASVGIFVAAVALVVAGLVWKKREDRKAADTLADEQFSTKYHQHLIYTP